MKNRIYAQLVLVSALAFSGAAQAYSFEMDAFAVWKNFDPTAIDTPADLLATSSLFTDNFDDLTPPPSGPNGVATYAMHGAMGPESAPGILTLDSADATPNSWGTPLQQAILKTDFDPLSPLGLKQGSSSFAVGGIFNLINPGNSIGAYGVRFTDAGAGNGNDIVSLSVRGREDGSGVVLFSTFDNTTGIGTIIGSQVLDAGHDQIGLGLAYMDPDGVGGDPKAVYAAFFYLDGGVPDLSFTSMAGSADLFNGENFTRAGFFAAAVNPVPVPEPETYAMLLAGLGLVGVAAWRRKQAEV
jgi:hypothetical protein